MYLRKILLNIFKSRCFQQLKLKAKGNIHKKRFYYQKNRICLETIIKKGFIIKKTGFDFEKKNQLRGKGFTQQKNRNCKRYKNIKTGFI